MKITCDLQDAYQPIKRGLLKMGERNNQGESIGVTNRYLLYNEKPWLPIMGEFQYSRYDRLEWETELLKMKACGIHIIASYFLWIHHEEEEGVFCFEGDRDVRHFIELCKKHGLYFYARIGPWVHGEARNGGFPDWLLPYQVRTNDPDYLRYVKRLYDAYYNQMKGLLFQDQGPVIGIQVENELVDNPEHLLKLKEMAIEAGLKVPLYTVTAWAFHGVAEFPPYEFIPVFGAYPEAPWRQNTHPFERKPNYLFVPGRNDITIGCDILHGFNASQTEDILEDYPYAYCEIGPGVPAMYHRRPIIDPYDLYTISIITLAKGNNLPGYYVFHGGRNPRGKLGLYQESRATGYLNDVPVNSYDFQAPIGEYGFVKTSYHYYRLLFLFLEQYGNHLAECETHFPDIAPRGRKDTFTPRCAVRTDCDGSGYLFFNTNQRREQLESMRNVQILLKNKDVVESVPLKPIDIPHNTTCFFPINQSIGKSTIIYALAQPITVISTKEAQYYFYAAIDGVLPEFLIKGETESIKTRGKLTSTKEGILISDLVTGYEPVISYVTDNKKVHIVMLKMMDALRLYHWKHQNQEYLFLLDSLIYFEENAVVLYGEAEEGRYECGVFPTLPDFPAVKEEKRGLFDFYQIPIKECKAEVTLKEVDSEIFLDNKYTPFLFTKDLADTKEYLMYLNIEQWGDMDDIKIQLDGEFDVFQIYEGKELTGDRFHTGGLLELGVKRHGGTLFNGQPLRIKISPLSSDKQIFLEQNIERDMAELSVYHWTPWYKKRLELD